MVELGDTETIGILDDHHRRGRYVHPYLDDGGSHQHINRPRPELGHDLLLGRRWELAVQQADPQSGQLLFHQAFPLGHHRGGLHPIGPFDQGTHHEGSVAGRDLAAYPLPGLGDVVRAAHPGRGDREPPGGSSSTMVMSRSPKTTMAAVRGMGVAVMTRRSGS